MDNYIDTLCNDKINCSLELTYDKIYTQNINDVFNPSQPFNTQHCGNYASFFIQYPCLIPPNYKDDR